MARLIFIGLVIVALALLWRGRDSAHGRAFKRLALIGFAAAVVLAILMPGTTTVVAGWIGIGRGADLVGYVTSFAVLFVATVFYLKFKRLEDRVAALTTELALRDWETQLTESIPSAGAPDPAPPTRF